MGAADNEELGADEETKGRGGAGGYKELTGDDNELDANEEKVGRGSAGGDKELGAADNEELGAKDDNEVNNEAASIVDMESLGGT